MEDAFGVEQGISAVSSARCSTAAGVLSRPLACATFSIPEYEGENTIVDGMILMERPKETDDKVRARVSRSYDRCRAKQ